MSNAESYQQDPRDWWETRRLKYNGWLVVAGLSAFILLVVCNPQLEINIFVQALQGLAYLFMMGVANVCYFLGPAVDRAFNHSNSDRFRRRLFQLGLGFSVALPLWLPVMVILLRVHMPASPVSQADIVGTWTSNRSFEGQLLGQDVIVIHQDGTYDHTYSPSSPYANLSPPAESKAPIGDWRVQVDRGRTLLTFDHFVWGFQDGPGCMSEPGTDEAVTWSVSVDRPLIGPLRLYFDPARDFCFAKAP